MNELLLKISATTYLLIGFVLSTAMAFAVSPGFFIVDEAIYYLGAEALSRGEFATENGWGKYGSNDLRLWFLRAGPEGLVPQYPHGAQILAAPLVAVLGPRSFILLNAWSAVVLIWVTWLIAKRAFNQQTAIVAIAILFFSTFLVEYAFAIWPHAMAAAAVLGAFYLAMRACETSDQRAFPLALASGLLVSIAFLIRLDSILIVPAIGVMAILWAPLPIRVLTGGGLGLAAGIVASAAINSFKFGTWNPLSYGSGLNGATSASSHAMTGLVLGMGALVVLIGIRVFPRRVSHMIIGATLIGAGTVIFLHPALRVVAGDVAVGIRDLVYDVTRVPDFREGIVGAQGDVRLFWGLPKKALAQSLPWLAVLVFLLLRPGDKDARKWLAVMALAIVIWGLPYIPRSWHGGFGLNLRYFLPVVPFIAILAAYSLVDLMSSLQRGPTVLLSFAFLGFSAAVFLTLNGWMTTGELHQVWTRHLFAAVAALVITAAMLPRKSNWLAAGLAVASVGVSLGAASKIVLIDDFALSQAVRRNNHASGIAFSKIEEPSLFYGIPAWFQFDQAATVHLYAAPDHWTGELDAELMHAAMADGRRVFVPLDLANKFALSNEALFGSEKYGANGRVLVELLSLNTHEMLSLSRVE